MENGFFHPDRGYWQTVSTPDADALQAYPEGTINVPLRPSGDHQWIDGEWILAAPTAEELAAYSAGKRWAIETGGTTWNGWPVHTDRESQSKIIAERLAVEAGVRADPDGWKFADGQFRLLTNAELSALSDAARAHVRQAFVLEAAVLAAIASGEITTYEQIDAMWAAALNP